MQMWKSISVKMILILIVCVFITLGITDSIFLLLQQRRVVREMEATADQTASRLSNSIVSPLWNLNKGEIEALIRYEMPNQNIFAVLVKHFDHRLYVGKIRNKRWEPIDYMEREEEKRALDEVFSRLEKPVERNRELIGHIEVFFTDKYLKEDLHRSILFAVLKAMLFSFILIPALYLSLRRIILQPLLRLNHVFQSFGVDNFHIRAKDFSQDEIGSLAQTFNNMGEQLEETFHKTQSLLKEVQTRQNELEDQKAELMGTNALLEKAREQSEDETWLKTGQTELGKQLRGEKDLATLAKDTVRFLTQYVGAQQGAFYLYEEERLNLLASYAFIDRKSNFNQFKLGEGLVGQAGLERNIIFFSRIDEEAPKINYGFDDDTPNYFIIMPIVHEKQLVGVLELASMQKFPARTEILLRESETSIAISINMVRSRQRMRQLLEETQLQKERLQVQQEELRQTNEELSAQAKALKESEERLQTQQEELRVTNEELEERSKILQEQRDANERKNRELEKAQREIEQKAQDLEQASRYKSEFLANMSHELRTPLNSILILSELLTQNKENNLQKKQLEFAETIHSSGEDLLNLINEILDLSKIEAGKTEVNPKRFMLRDFMEEVKRLFNHFAEEKQLTYQLQLQDQLPNFVVTDEQRLHQVLRNLLSNAFKFTDTGSIEFGVKRPEKSNVKGLELDTSLAFYVKDTGIGIPQEKHKIIFEAFQQADGSTSRQYGGTGLGLSISRRLAELLGGELVLESAIGEGSCFTLIIPQQLTTDKVIQPSFSFPQKLQLQPDAKPPVEKVIPKKINGGQKIDDRDQLGAEDQVLLIIDDDMSFARILMDLAHEKNYKCLIANDGEEGIHLASYYKPNAIILDIGLPGIDGWGVMDWLKENAETRHIPVHFISAKDETINALRKGAIGFLTKPVDMEKLEQVFLKITNMAQRPVKRILIVEDNDVQRKTIAELVGGKNVEILSANSGQTALEILENDIPDCIILDLGLGDVSGFELLSQIRQREKMSRIPIIIYTGKDLSRKEEIELEKFAESIIIKGARSPERLLAETTLFLHSVERNLPKKKQKMLRMVYDKDGIFKEKKILLVDDDMRNVFALTSVLEEKEMEVIVGRDGREAIEQLKKHPDTHLVFMDIMMPGMDGYEAMERIRRMEQFKRLPIIALTAKAMKDDKNKCIQAGANDYLAKPVDIEKLFALLRVWLYHNE